MRSVSLACAGCLFVLLPGVGVLAGEGGAPSQPVDYNRDIRPILSNYCYACHGPDGEQRKADLRLDRKEDALGELPSGERAVVPGDLKHSALIARVTSTDEDQMMPPKEVGKRLSADQVAILRRWVEQGAAWKPHWSFIAPHRPELPAIGNKNWARNSIDYFILARLEKEGLSPSREADRTTLIRRVTFDLTGLPPSPAEVDAFLADKSPEAYERVVERLLASPRYGERMAIDWLDAARYADTHGFHIDSHRDMWRWRDWVIGAFNSNLPFDRFTVEQLAGDLLPHATEQQKIATGFNRNHMINFEGGAIAEEYQNAYIVDRVNTTATVWLGLTIGCAQCHDHKFDPVTQKEFYGLYAFFNNVPENGLDGRTGNAVPLIKAPLPQQETELVERRDKVSKLEEKMEARVAEAEDAFAAWAHNAQPRSNASLPPGLAAYYKLDELAGSKVLDSAGQQPGGRVEGGAAYTAGKYGSALRFANEAYAELGDALTLDHVDKFSYGAWIQPTAATQQAAILARVDDQLTFRGCDLYTVDGKIYVNLVHQWPINAIRVRTKKAVELNKWSHVFATYDGSGKAAGVKVYIHGAPAELEITHDSLSGTIVTDKPLRLGRRHYQSFYRGLIDEVRIYRRELSAAEVATVAALDPLEEILAVPLEKRTLAQRDALRKHFLENVDPQSKVIAVDLAKARKALTDLVAAIPTTMIMREMDRPRDTFLLMRGQYDKLGEKVQPGTPASLPRLPQGAPHNRLGLAQWLVDPTHPLTSRVMVNRYWQMYFGNGIVKSAEDFGAQGEWPSHPELLDWLATELSGNGWNVKALQRLIVTSATYRQASAVTPRLVEKDPENRLFARGPRVRLYGEFIRDQALTISGLLNPQIGGPSVFPYQAPGIWEEMAFGGEYSAQSYTPSKGKDLYRRSMYTFWKRTVPPVTLSTFDAPDREVCAVRRQRTNTPLQALILMNDETYIEASRKLAERLMSDSAASAESRIAKAFTLATARAPSDKETAILRAQFDEQLAVFRKDTQAAVKLLSVGEAPRDGKHDPAELAAWTTVVSTILNLDETVTKG